MAAAAISLCGASPVAVPVLGERAICRRDAWPRARLSSHRKLVILSATEGSAKSSSEAEEQVPSWAKPGSDEPPPWARDDGGTSTGAAQEVQVPFYAYLLASTVTAIAAIGSIFEYANQKPVFGLVSSDSPLYAPILGFFAFTGIPTAGFLWYKAVQTANKDAEEQDRRDGFL